MSLDVTSKVIAGLVILVAIIAIAWMFLTKGQETLLGLLPAKDNPAPDQTGTTPTGQLIVGSDTKYVNPLICAVTGQFCDPNAGTPAQTTTPSYVPDPTDQVTMCGNTLSRTGWAWMRQNDPVRYAQLSACQGSSGTGNPDNTKVSVVDPPSWSNFGSGLLW